MGPDGIRLVPQTSKIIRAAPRAGFLACPPQTSHLFWLVRFKRTYSCGTAPDFDRTYPRTLRPYKGKPISGAQLAIVEKRASARRVAEIECDPEPCQQREAD
jgi:hypothetical protein